MYRRSDPRLIRIKCAPAAMHDNGVRTCVVADMKVQSAGQHLRVRVDETDLARLLAQGELDDTTQFGPDTLQHRRLALVDSDAPRLDYAAGSWRLCLPRDAVERFVTSRPRRDALELQLWADTGAPLAVAFEVDIRRTSRSEQARR